MIFLPVSARPPSSPSRVSSLATVGYEILADLARSFCDHPSIVRAAFTCLIETTAFAFDSYNISPRSKPISSTSSRHLSGRFCLWRRA